VPVPCSPTAYPTIDEIPAPCLSVSKGVSSFENPYATLRHQASVPAIPPLRAAFCTARHFRHVLKGVSRPRGAVYPIASLLTSLDQFTQSSSLSGSRGGGRAG